MQLTIDAKRSGQYSMPLFSPVIYREHMALSHEVHGKSLIYVLFQDPRGGRVFLFCCSVKHGTHDTTRPEDVGKHYPPPPSPPSFPATRLWSSIFNLSPDPVALWQYEAFCQPQGVNRCLQQGEILRCILNKYETSNQRWFSAGPPSQTTRPSIKPTLAQRILL